MVRIALPGQYAGALLRGVIEQPAHLLSVQACCASLSGGGAKDSGDAMGALVALHLKVQGSEGHGHARPDIVTERHGAQKVVPADAEFLPYGESGGYPPPPTRRLRH